MIKKILYIYHVSSIGGGSYCLLNILKEVDRKKFCPIVLLRMEGPLAVEIRNLGIEVYTLPSLRTVPYNSSLFKIVNILSLLNLFKSFGKYKKLLKKIHPDLVYINSMMLYPYLRIAKKYGFKTIIHIREHWPIDKHNIQRKIALNDIKKYADQIVAINSYSASMFNDIKERIEIVYDWIDFTNRYESMPFNEIFNEDTSKLKIFLFTGGLQIIKGTYEVLKTFTEEISDKDKRLLVLGVDTNIHYFGLKRLVKLILSILGYKTYAEKVAALIKNDERIVCIPSTYKIHHILEQTYCLISYYTIPHANLALAESIITKTLSVAAMTEESLEYSINGKLAVIYRMNDRRDFADKLKSVESQFESKKSLLETDSHFISEMFNRKANADRLAQIYNKLLQEKQK